jgi:UDP-N-acetylmuramate--alanine ligase
MAALAEVLHHRGTSITGSDVEERFYTDELLQRIGVTPLPGFSPDHIGPDVDFLVYSAAYDEDNPERREAQRRGLPQFSYNEMLGALSRGVTAVAVSGVHGKTSTTAITGIMASRTDLPVTVVVGSAVTGFAGSDRLEKSATLIQGGEVLIAETCEYRRHFLYFHPSVLIVTSVEADHLDYFRDVDDVSDAFVEFGRKLPNGGTLVYCADDAGARRVARRLQAERTDLVLQPYGFNADGVGAVTAYTVKPGEQSFRMAGLEERAGGCGAVTWTVGVPGRHMVVNAAGALTALQALYPSLDGSLIEAWRSGLASFKGTSRRSEQVAEVDDVLILDDYAHHPTAIRTTLDGFRRFWPGRRIVVDFMSHTYTRTEALLDDFVTAFDQADVLFLNEIYSSAREHYSGGMTGESFADAVGCHHRDVRFVPTFEKAAESVVRELRTGDVFVTMGAGDNFRIGRRVAEMLALRGKNR